MLDNILKIEISANIVAWYGAIISTVSILLAFMNYFRDKAKIKVKISQGLFAYGTHLGNEVKVFIEIINIGRRPITLTGAGLTLKNGKNMFILKSEFINFPFELLEGKSAQVEFNRDEVFEESKKEKSKILYAWYKTATGKMYKIRFPYKYGK